MEKILMGDYDDVIVVGARVTQDVRRRSPRQEWEKDLDVFHQFRGNRDDAM